MFRRSAIVCASIEGKWRSELTAGRFTRLRLSDDAALGGKIDREL